MAVQITFEPAGLTGLVGEGAYLSDAARRMGVMLSVDCKGRGECTSCLVTILSGAELLSAPTQAELGMLGANASFQPQRLACQVRIETSGELVVHVDPEKQRAEKPTDSANVRKRFGELALDKKIATLIQLEALTMYEALNAIVEKPLAVGEKVFDRILNKAKAAEIQKRSVRRPPEHR